MSIKKGEIKDLQYKYGVEWGIYSDFGNYNPYDPMQKMLQDKETLKKLSPEEHDRKMGEEWVIDNSSQEEDGNYFLHDAGIFSETEMIIKSGKIDIESALKACDEILRKENTMTLHYIERFGKKESVNGKDCIKVGFGT
tara:strand:+ start:51 stop:467 length:417 start_codon:yes stop_codon:yes gene_type:complete